VFYESGGAQRASLDVPGTPGRSRSSVDRTDLLLDTSDSVDAHFPGFKTPEQAAIFSTPRVDPIMETFDITYATSFLGSSPFRSGLERLFGLQDF
jgi:hypothetical protein